MILQILTGFPLYTSLLGQQLKQESPYILSNGGALVCAVTGKGEFEDITGVIGIATQINEKALIYLKKVSNG
ncbi:MAG: hypothetical protein JRE40_09770 [Deltaproteobacteria bacterium]|nr:hypothetical protein [Deltaproteobacteria bacterium]MBW2672858.1 hypothetical protein [Deltaproteobacteria bacterium]